MTTLKALLAPFSLAVLTPVALAQSWLPTSIDPPWGKIPATRTISFTYDDLETSLQNGARLAGVVSSLVPGDRLVIGPGTYSMQQRFEVFLQGTPQEPIWIVAEDLADKPVITRPDKNQNIVNIGLVSGGQSRYLALQGLEVTGGSDLIRIYDCENIWIDQCYIHDGEGVGIAANSNDASYLYITRNEIARPDTANPVLTGEAMYLGQNNGTYEVSYSIVARNYVHETQVANPGPSYQGDGIEIKQGSHHNWIVENHVHSTKLPGIVVYGTGDSVAPNGENVIERNLVYDCQDNVIQAQGDAIVRNNVAIYTEGNGAAFQSFSSQGPVRNLTVVHNTFINVGRAANFNDWNNAPNMVFANNVAYSQTTTSLNFVGGSSGVELAGNIVVGQAAGTVGGIGYTFGCCLADFKNASWDATKLDVTPTTGRVIDNHGAWEYLEPIDILGRPRSYPADPGAVENDLAALPDLVEISAATGGAQTFTLDAGSFNQGRTYWLLGTLTDVVPALTVDGYDIPLVLDSWTSVTFAPNAGLLVSTLGTLDAQGMVTDVQVLVPPVPGTTFFFQHCFTVWVTGTSDLKFVSNPVPLLVR